MKILPRPLIFEWDKGNTDKNFRKHGITDRESEETFNNKPLFISLDRKHSKQEELRYNALGRTNEKTVLFLSFTIRDNKVRIISARQASRKERSMYAKK